MPFTEQYIYTLNKLNPLLAPELAVSLSRRFQASQTILKGQPVGLVTTAVNAVQTLTITGTPTGGTFKLSFQGIKTAAIAYNASAAVVQAALEAIISIGTGGVVCGGGALPGTAVTITFSGTNFAGLPQPLVVFETGSSDNLLTGGTTPTGSVANTTTGVQAGAMKAWVGDLITPPTVPTVSAVSGGTGFGDGTNSMPYTVSVTFYNESGETTTSPAATVLVTSANRTIRVAAYSSVNANIQGARYYVNGVLAGTTTVSSGNIAQTDLTAFTAGGGTFPEINGCFATRDGSHYMRGIALCDIYTDAEGRVTFGRVSTGMEQGQELTEAPIYIQGIFRIGDLNGITSTNGPQMNRFGRFFSGDWSVTEGIYRFGLL
jgi:hypothetical protein